MECIYDPRSEVECIGSWRKPRPIKNNRIPHCRTGSAGNPNHGRGAVPCRTRFHDNSSTDISSTTLRLQTFRLQTFRLLLYTSVQDSYTSNFSFSISLFSSIPTSTYTMIPLINLTSTDTMIIQHNS